MSQLCVCSVAMLERSRSARGRITECVIDRFSWLATRKHRSLSPAADQTQGQIYSVTILGFIPEQCWSRAQTATSHSQTPTWRYVPSCRHVTILRGKAEAGTKLHIQATVASPDWVLRCWQTPSAKTRRLARTSCSSTRKQPVTFYNLLLLLRATDRFLYFMFDMLAGCFKTLGGNN